MYMCRSDEYVANTLVLLDYYPLTSGGDWSIEVFHDHSFRLITLLN
jgi:hypothetical protein